MLTKFVISGSFFSRFLSFFQHLKVIKFSSLKQQQIYGSVTLSRSRTSAILAQFFLIHVICRAIICPHHMFFMYDCYALYHMMLKALVLFCKGRELNLAATLASQPAAGHSLNFIITIVIMTLG